MEQKISMIPSINGVRTILSLSLIGLIILSLKRIIKNETATKTYFENGTAKFPSMTICPLTFQKPIKEISINSNFSWDDFMDLPNLTSLINVTLIQTEFYDMR